MSTDIRPELRITHKYWISKERYYELKHFCMQYQEWLEALSNLSSIGARVYDQMFIDKKYGNPTEKEAEARIFYTDKIEMVERAAIKADKELAYYIVMAVTKGVSYEFLKTNHNIPACKDVYFDRYRKFFWILSKMRQ